MSQIGVNIKKLRKVKGLSQQAFGELFNLTRGNISSYEEFRAEPRIEVILLIAKYFSIPVAELLESQLTVNEILNFEDHFENDNSKLDTKGLTEIPFLSREVIQRSVDFVFNLDELPRLYFPLYNKYPFLAVENTSFIPQPSDFPFEEQSILFFEQAHVEILHTLKDHFGFYAQDDQLLFGKYIVEGSSIELVLNEWKKISFTQDNQHNFWKLYGKFDKVL